MSNEQARIKDLEDENKRLKNALMMCDYVASTIHEASSESGTIERARDIRRRVAELLGDRPYRLLATN